MNAIKNGHRPGASEPPIGEATGIVDSRGGTRYLELQVNIGGQPHKVWLSLGALQDQGVSGPAAAEELRGIREALGGLREAVEALAPFVQRRMK